MLIGYARCLTDAQDLTAQHNALTTFGVKANRIYVDHGLLARRRRAATLDLTTVLTTTVTTVAVPATPPTRPFAADLALSKLAFRVDQSGLRPVPGRCSVFQI